MYHEIVDALLHPKIPVMQNTDGDPLELTTLTYALAVPAAVAVEPLTPPATLRDEAHIADDTYDATGALCSARIHESQLVVEVNSARRRRRIEKEIAKHLGSAATLVDTTITDISEMLEQRRASASGAGSSLAPQDTLPSSPELQALEAELAPVLIVTPRGGPGRRLPLRALRPGA